MITAFAKKRKDLPKPYISNEKTPTNYHKTINSVSREAEDKGVDDPYA